MTTNPRTVTLDVPWMGPSMNTIWAGHHWSFRKKLAEASHLAVLSVAKGIDPFSGPVSLHFTPFHKGRHFDPSNYSVAVKACEDGLTLCGILPCDTSKTVKQLTIYAPVKIKEGQSFMRVEITDYLTGEK